MHKPNMPYTLNIKKKSHIKKIKKKLSNVITRSSWIKWNRVEIEKILRLDTVQ